MSDDLQWRRPNGDPSAGDPAHPAADPARPNGDPARPGDVPAGPPPYQGPPRSAPPPHGWRPRLLVQPPAPRALPGQNLGEIETREHEARVITYGVGMLAGAILLIVLFVLCGRVVF